VPESSKSGLFVIEPQKMEHLAVRVDGIQSRFQTGAGNGESSIAASEKWQS